MNAEIWLGKKDLKIRIFIVNESSYIKFRSLKIMQIKNSFFLTLVIWL